MNKILVGSLLTLGILFSGCAEKSFSGFVPIQKSDVDEKKGLVNLTNCPEYTYIESTYYDSGEYYAGIHDDKIVTNTIKEGKSLKIGVCIDRDVKDPKRDLLKYELTNTNYRMGFDFSKHKDKL